MEKKKLLIEQSEFSFRVANECVNLTESLKIEENEEAIIIKHVPCTILGKKNLNGRIYPANMMKKSLADARDQIKSRSLLCQAHDHPEGTFVKPIEASHLIIDAYIEDVPNVGPVLFNDWEVLPTSHGKDLAALIERNVSLGTSIRGLGNMSGSVVEGYEFLGTDVVGNPSSGTFTKMFESAKAVKVSREKLDEMMEAKTYEVDEIIVDGEKLDDFLDKAEKADKGEEKKEGEEGMKEDAGFADIRKAAEDIYNRMLNNKEHIDPEGTTLESMAREVADKLGVPVEDAEKELNMALIQLHGASWYDDLVVLTGSDKAENKSTFSQEDLNSETSQQMSEDELIANQPNNTLGESKMINVDISDLPELKQLQKGDDAIAIHQSPDSIERPLEAITAEETPNKGALKAGPNAHVGDEPSPEDIKKVKYQAYDTNNILAREKTKMQERCQELAQMLAVSRQNLAEYAEKYKEAQNIVTSLVEQLSVINKALDNKTPETVKAEYEKQIADLKESNKKEYVARKEKAVKYVQSLMKESTEKFEAVAKDYEGKLAEKDQTIADLNKKLEESADESKLYMAEVEAEKVKMQEAAKEATRAECEKLASKASSMNERLVKESVTLINKALLESSKAQDKLVAEVEAQKGLFEEVTKYFEIACVINDSLSEALTEECEGRCGKRRKESPARRMRGRR